MIPLRHRYWPTPASIKMRKAIVARLGRDKPVTFEAMKRWKFRQPDGRVPAKINSDED
jgi:hypothetical protein